MLRHLQRLFLSVAKWGSPIRGLRYLFTLWSAMSRKYMLKCGASNSHTAQDRISSPKTPTISEEKTSHSEGVNRSTTVRHVVFRDPPESHIIPMSSYEANITAMVDEGAYDAQTHAVCSPLSTGTHTCKPPLMEGKILDKLPSLFNMLFLLDHPGFIQRSLAATQGKRKADIRKWDEFSPTVLLAANVSFLAIQTIDNAGLSYLPQRFSYISVLAVLASIVMGSAVRILRLFVSALYFSSLHSCPTVSTMQQPFNLSSLSSLERLCYLASLATG
ncbi:hypothetical protein V8B97DRAFT_2026836 [Scleroderma yunnanense]